MFSNIPRSNECVSTANSMSYQQNAHWLCYGLTSRAPQPALPFLKCLVWAGETRGQCNPWKIHRWPHREGRGRLYTNVESTRWGGGWLIHPPKISPCSPDLLVSATFNDAKGDSRWLWTPREVQWSLWTADPNWALNLVGRRGNRRCVLHLSGRN